MYYNDFISDEIKNSIYSYIQHIKEFENFDSKILEDTYMLRNYSDKSKYIFSIDYECNSNRASVDGIVKIEEEGYTLQYTSSLDRTVKADSFRIEDDKVVRKSYNLSTKATEEKEFDKNIFFSNKTYKKD